MHWSSLKKNTTRIVGRIINPRPRRLITKAAGIRELQLKERCEYKARLLRSNQMDGSMPRLWTIGGRGAERRMEAERMKGRGRRLMAAAVLSLQETEEWKTKRDYRQFKQGCTHTRLLIEKRISPLDYDDIKRWNAPSDSKSSLFLRASKLSGGTLSWLIVSLWAEAQNKLYYCHLKKKRGNVEVMVGYTRGNTSPTHTHTHRYIYIDGRPIRKVLFDQPWEKELSESEPDFRSVERGLKIQQQRKGKLLESRLPRLVISCPEM